MSDDTALVLVDSNIWLYMFMPGQDRHKAQIAVQLMAQYANRIAISTQVINETVRNLHRNRVMTEQRTRDLINSFYQDYHVVQMNHAIQIIASHLREQYTISYWDSLLVAAGLEIKAGTLFSEDMHNGLVIEGQLMIVNPFLSA